MVLEEEEDDDAVASLAKKLASQQREKFDQPQRGHRAALPIEKVAEDLERRRRDTVLVASDGSGIRIFKDNREKRGGNYRPEEARERMSINWM